MAGQGANSLDASISGGLLSAIKKAGSTFLLGRVLLRNIVLLHWVGRIRHFCRMLCFLWNSFKVGFLCLSVRRFAVWKLSRCFDTLFLSHELPAKGVKRPTPP